MIVKLSIPEGRVVRLKNQAESVLWMKPIPHQKGEKSILSRRIMSDWKWIGIDKIDPLKVEKKGEFWSFFPDFVLHKLQDIVKSDERTDQWYAGCVLHGSWIMFRRPLSYHPSKTTSMRFLHDIGLSDVLPTIPEESTSSDMRSDIPVIQVASNPKKTITTDITPDKMGRLINISNIGLVYLVFSISFEVSICSRIVAGSTISGSIVIPSLIICTPAYTMTVWSGKSCVT